MQAGLKRPGLILWALAVLFKPRAESLQILKHASCLPPSRVTASSAKLPRCGIRQYAEKSPSNDNGLGKPALNSPSPQKATESLVEDDGYAATVWGSSRLGRMRRWLRTIRVGKRGLAFRRALPQALKKTPGTLILVRHGESAWNQNKTFTGWCDPGLSTRGEREVEHAARLLLEGGYEIDVCYTSRLQRAIRSTWIILQEMNTVYLPVYKSWRLNERMYGALQGLSKVDVASQLGVEQVQQWRGGYRIRPPPLTPASEHWPGYDRKHFDLSPSQIPLTESLEDCMNRTRSLWETRVVTDLAHGLNVLVVAHGNSLRGLVKLIDKVSDQDIEQVAIPTGIPLIYKFDRNLEPIRQTTNDPLKPSKEASSGSSTESSPPTSEKSTTAAPPDGDRPGFSVMQAVVRGTFLEEKGVLRRALEQEEEWASMVPGYNEVMRSDQRLGSGMTPYLRSLSKLEAERQLKVYTQQVATEKVQAAALAKKALLQAELKAAASDPQSTGPFLEAAAADLAAAADEAAKALSEAAKAMADISSGSEEEGDKGEVELPLQDALPNLGSVASSNFTPYNQNGVGPGVFLQFPQASASFSGQSDGRPSVYDFFGEASRKNGYSVDVDGVGPGSFIDVDSGNAGATAPIASPSYPTQLSPAYPATRLAAGARAAANFVARRAALLSSRGRTRADEGSRGAGGRSSLDREPAATSSGIVYDAQLVIIRHGKTEFNKLGLFTGWDDAPLAPEGRDEAIAAGQLLKAHGLTFDVVYTSWLSRAIETAWLVLSELDLLWLPIVKSWRLNERMYGALTGLSKRMVKERHGATKFKNWRRGFHTQPPPVSSFSQFYPGNDVRYVRYLTDVRWSVTETLIRSLEGRKLKLHRQLPKTESLKDCMDRTIPYFKHNIVPNSINLGKRVLIASSENAIRGLLMHLCDIPEDRISEVEIPTGLPLLYDARHKCIKLLGDESGLDPLARYNFGTAADLLFKTSDRVIPLPGELPSFLDEEILEEATETSEVRMVSSES